ncbi:MAG TPA: hypothetical protein VJ577_02680 [Burkholderiaceae bacterium]|nr:hypothetical protein [Burkholderiaceae bacterium]
MIDFNAIRQALNSRKSKLLDMAQAAFPQSQYIAFRKLLLNELGKQGFEQDLERILAEGSRQHKERAGQADMSKKGGAP